MKHFNPKFSIVWTRWLQGRVHQGAREKSTEQQMRPGRKAEKLYPCGNLWVQLDARLILKSPSVAKMHAACLHLPHNGLHPPRILYVEVLKWHIGLWCIPLAGHPE